MSRLQYHEWCKYFQSSRIIVKNDLKSGWLFKLTNDKNIDDIHFVICASHCLTVWEITKEVGINIESFDEILIEKYLACVAFPQTYAISINRRLEENHINISQNLPHHTNTNENFLKILSQMMELWIMATIWEIIS